MSVKNKVSSPVAGVSYLYMAAAFVIVVTGMRAAEAILNPLLLAVFLSIVSAPAYFGLLKRGVSTWLALLTVIAGLSIMAGAVAFVLLSSIQGFNQNQEHYRERLGQERRRVVTSFSTMLPDWLEDAEDEAEDDAKTPQEEDSSALESVDAWADDDSESKASNNEGSTDSVAASAAYAAETDTAPTNNLTEDVEDASAVALESSSEQHSTPQASLVELPEPHFQTGIPFPPAAHPLPETEQSWRDYLSEQFNPATAISLAASVVGSIGAILSNTFLILLTVIFILLEAGSFNRKLVDAFGKSESTAERAEKIIKSVHHYILMKTWISLGTGILVTTWLWWWGVSHSPLWGLLAFLFNYVPNVGSIIAAIPAILVAWLEVGDLPVLAIAIGLIIINGAIGNFIEPRLMGKGLGLSALVVFFSMIFWGAVLGPVGMLLSVPLTMTARIVLDGFEDTRWVSTLMGSAD